MSAGLLGFVSEGAEGGRVVCVDCDIYPPGTVAVTTENVHKDDRCDLCNALLIEVDPVGPGPFA